MLQPLKGHRRPDDAFIPRRRIAIGDIHGQFLLMKDLIENKIKFNPDEDVLVFLGDYIDRGANAADEMDVLNYLIELVAKAPGKVVLLRGNHEQMAIDAISSPTDDNLDLWAMNGCKEKIYWTFADMMQLLHFCRSLPHSYETEKHLFVHAGALDGQPIKEQDKYMLLWEREVNQYGYMGKTLVVGHTPRRSVLVSDKVINVDTGAFRTGVLSAYDTLNGTTFVSSRS